MKQLIILILLIGSLCPLFGQEYCQYCVDYYESGYSKSLNISDVYSIPKDGYGSPSNCSIYRDDVVKSREKRIREARYKGYSIEEYYKGNLCDEYEEREKAERDKKAEQDYKDRKAEKERLAQIEKMNKAEAEKRQREQAAIESRAKAEQTKERNVRLTKDHYESKGPKPDSIEDGWHTVTIIENESKIYEKIVQVENNRIVSYIARSTAFKDEISKVYSGPIQRAKTMIKVESKYLEIFFMNYLDDSMSREKMPMVGDFTFWTSSKWADPIEIRIKGKLVGTIKKALSHGSPVCGEKNALTLEGFRTGTYTFTARSKDGIINEQGEIRIFPEECGKYQIKAELGKTAFWTDQEQYLPLQVIVSDQDGTQVYQTEIKQAFALDAGPPSQKTLESSAFLAQAGSYTYTIKSKNKSYDWIETRGTVEIHANQYHSSQFRPQQASFSFHIDSLPPNKRIYLTLDGKSKGMLQEKEGQYSFSGQYKPGTYSYSIIDPQNLDYSWKGELRLDDGKEQQISLKANVLYSYAVFFISNPRVRKFPITWLVDGKEVGVMVSSYPNGKRPKTSKDPQAIYVKLPVGKHQVRIETEGPWTLNTEIDMVYREAKFYRLAKNGRKYYLQAEITKKD